MLTKEQFFSENRVTKYNKILNLIDKNKIECEYTTYGIHHFLNGIFSISIPTEKQEDVLYNNMINIDEYVFDNLSCIIGKIVKSLEKYDIECLNLLKDAIWDLYIDLNTNKFDPPNPKENFDFNKHDKSLQLFKDILIKHTTILKGKTTDEYKIVYHIFLAYAHSIFEVRQFQGPYRIDSKDAIKDSLGRDHLWNEYIISWGIYNNGDEYI